MHLKGVKLLLPFLHRRNITSAYICTETIFDGINQASDLAGDKNASLNDSKITSNYS